jgi:hypothetical protein
MVEHRLSSRQCVWLCGVVEQAALTFLAEVYLHALIVLLLHEQFAAQHLQTSAAG